MANWRRSGLILLYAWLTISLFFGYRDYLNFISKLKDARQEHINVYFVSEVLSKLKPNKNEPVLIVLPPSLSTDERWFYHYRIRYKAYPQMIDFAEPFLGIGLRKVSYDFRQYKGKLPISIDPSNLLPLRYDDYRYMFTIAGAEIDSPRFFLITDATEIKGKVYQRKPQ